MSYIEKIAIANRSEVAVRLIRGAQELGLKTVLLHSEPDRHTLAYRLSDEKVCIGPADVKESYLNIERNIEGAVGAGADALHPGFGFLSENPELALACESHGLTFIGPSVENLELFSDKLRSKEVARSIDCPVLSESFVSDSKHLLKQAEKIGYPLMIKATSGGGGRGLRVVRSPEEALLAFESAQREAQLGFGSSQIFLEAYLDKAKHIEVQIFGDASGKIHTLFERECSIQRRHQKVLEESPCVFIEDSLKQQIFHQACRMGEVVGYKGAGTVEFLVQGDAFYFLELNPRLQVEHPITEMVLNIDLVKAQILTAQGQGLLWENIQPRGHALECRVYAEDPYREEMPSAGELLFLHWPQGPGRRFEVGYETGDHLSSFYDPLLAKVIVWDENRPRALQKMKDALKNCVVFGIKTNIPYLQEILSHPDFVDGSFATTFLEKNFPKGLTGVELESDHKELAQKVLTFIKEGGLQGVSEETLPSSPSNPWFHKWEKR